MELSELYKFKKMCTVKKSNSLRRRLDSSSKTQALLDTT